MPCRSPKFGYIGSNNLNIVPRRVGMKFFATLVLAYSITAFAGEMKPLNVGESAPSFSLKNYDGREIDLKSTLKDHKFAVVMFISTQCPVSNGYNDRMEKLYETYSGKGIAFIAVNANKAEDIQAIADHAKEHGFKFPVVKDVANKIADQYDAQVTPEIFVLNPEGKLVYHGRIDDSRNPDKVTSHDLADALDKLIAGKELSVTTTKAFGCSIKRMTP